jgi:predicted NAD-dependent protein-ADP-ribosyltransferase YbiA (DUF1768 family)
MPRKVHGTSRDNKWGLGHTGLGSQEELGVILMQKQTKKTCLIFFALTLFM